MDFTPPSFQLPENLVPHHDEVTLFIYRDIGERISMTYFVCSFTEVAAQ